MIRRPPRSTRTYTLVPYTTRFRSLAAHQGQCDRRRDERSHAQRHRQADFGFAGGLRPQPPFFLRRDRAEAKPETKARLEGPCTTPNPSRRHFDKLNGSSGRTEFSDYAALSQRSEEHRVGKGCGSTWRSRWWPDH